jgi:hypothetical protein
LQEADKSAADAMRSTEAVVKDELEAAAVYAQVKAAVEAAEKSLAQIHATDDEAEVEAAEAAESHEVRATTYTGAMRVLLKNRNPRDLACHVDQAAAFAAQHSNKQSPCLSSCAVLSKTWQQLPRPSSLPMLPPSW